MTFQSWKQILTMRIKFVLNALQWSHDFSVMETTHSIRLTTMQVQASMEPWLFSHGNSIFVRLTEKHLNASMEPWLFSHGNILSLLSLFFRVLCFNGAMTFQSWKHTSIQRATCRIIPLQWSHDFSVMETAEAWRTVTGLQLASMEPWLFSHGNKTKRGYA